MYDRKSEANEFVGDSVAEATAEAARFFGVEAGELKVVVPEFGEVSGAGGRAVIVAVPKSLAGARPRRSERDEPRERDSGRGEGRRDRGRRDRGDRDRGGRGDRGGHRERGDRGERGERGARAERGDRSERTADSSADAAEAVDSKGTVEGEVGAVAEFVLGAVERMCLGDFSLKETEEDDFLVCQLRGQAAAALVSGDGRAVDALQQLASQVARRVSDDAPRVVIDVEGDAEDREESLRRLADRAAGRARDTGRSVALDPMNGRDRRIIHVALRDQDKVATMSIGDGRYRQVLVVPEGADEYEEAVEASQSADA